MPKVTINFQWALPIHLHVGSMAYVDYPGLMILGGHYHVETLSKTSERKKGCRDLLACNDVGVGSPPFLHIFCTH